MAKKKAPTVNGDANNLHTVVYNESNGEKVIATFPTAAHASVLKDRLRHHNIPYHSESPAVPEPETASEDESGDE